MMTDPIADMLTRIRNASHARFDKVDVPFSKLKLEIARVLKEEGFIREYEFIKEGPQGVIRVYLKYTPDRSPVIHGIRRVSKPGLRKYAGHKDLPRVLSGLGVAVVSTSRGVLTDKQARAQGVGGEILCYVW